MQISFYIISVIGTSYFLLAKRRFDWFAVAFFSACIYFLPGYFGYTSYLTLTEWVESPINGEAYLIMITVFIMILSSAIVSDLFSKEIHTYNIKQTNDIVLDILLIMATVSLLLMFLTTGTAMFNVDKLTMLEELNRSNIVFYTSTMVGATLSFERKKLGIFSIFCLFIMFDLYIGFRTSFALSFISIFTLWLSKQGKTRLLLSFWKQSLAGLFLLLFLLFFKQIAFAVRSGDVTLLKTVISNHSVYSLMITNSEPFVTQTILNAVTQNHYYVGLDHLKGLFYQLIMFAPQLGVKVVSFNDLFQKDLFPEVGYGMANNIWAEMWSAGGWPLLMLFLLTFVIIVYIATLSNKLQNPNLRSVFAVMASYWTFYIHRNDIAYEVNLEKRVLLVAGIAFVLAAFIRWVITTIPVSKSTHPDKSLNV